MNPYQNNGPQNGAPGFGANGTRVVNPARNPAGATRPSGQPKKGGDASKWALRSAGAAGGILLGSVAAYGMNAMMNAEEPVEERPLEMEPECEATPLTDGELTYASGNYDDMSFGQAFAAVRQEYGPGAVFQWHGGLYGSYTAEEWNAMSPEERADYASHVNYDAVEAPSQPAHNSNGHYAQTNTQQTQQSSTMHTPGHGDQAADPQIEVLDAYTTEDGANVVAVAIDNDPVVLIDEDGDQVFDYMAMDLNGNGRLDDGELMDISDQNISMADVGVRPEQPGGNGGLQVTDVTVDPDSGATFVSVNAGGTEGVFVDVDGDQVMDYLAVDYNGNGQLDEGEVTDISGENISMADLGVGTQQPTPPDNGIQVNDVYISAESGATFVDVSANGTDAVLVDLDNDQTMDLMIVDFNGNGRVEDDEIMDISGQNLTMGDLGVDPTGADIV